MHLVWRLLVVVFMLGQTGRAAAGPPSKQLESSEAAAVSSEREPEYDDYRLTLLATDATAISLVVGGALLSDETVPSAALLTAGIGTYALGGPIVHLAHVQSGRAAASFGLRVGVPLIGIGLGAGMAASCQPGESQGWCEVAAVAFGGLVGAGGIVAAIIIDDGFLGQAPKPLPKDEARTVSSFRAGFLPLYEPKTKLVGLSLVGEF